MEKISRQRENLSAAHTDTVDIWRCCNGRPIHMVRPKILKIIFNNRIAKYRETADVLKISTGSELTMLHAILRIGKRFFK